MKRLHFFLIATYNSAKTSREVLRITFDIGLYVRIEAQPHFQGEQPNIQTKRATAFSSALFYTRITYLPLGSQSQLQQSQSTSQVDLLPPSASIHATPNLISVVKTAIL